MRIPFLPLALACLCLTLSALLASAAPGEQVFDNSIRPVDSTRLSGPSGAHRPFIARRNLQTTETSATIEFEVVLKMRNFSDLRTRLGQQQRFTPQQMAANYHPLPSSATAVSAWLTRNGFIITHADPENLAIFAKGTVEQIQRVMGTEFARVDYENQQYTSAITAPNVPDALAPFVLGINGLQPHIQHRKNLVMTPITPNAATPYNPPFTPSAIAKAYNATPLYSSNINGTDQSIAIIIDTFPNTADLTSFWTLCGIPQSLNNITFAQVVAGVLPPRSGEETLDVQWASSMAPGAKIRVYAAQSLGFVALDRCYSAVLADANVHREYGIHQMSMSYGTPENLVSSSQLDTDAQYFASLANAGVTVFASSGDMGANPDIRYPSQLGICPEYPACDPNVIGVGGTALTMNSAGTVTSEPVWNDGNYHGDGLTWATGGGISAHFARPSWQTGLGVPTGSMRLVPDVAAVAAHSTGGLIIFNGSTYSVGGTSWSSAVWSGFCALFNQYRAVGNLPALGNFGHYLYPCIGSPAFRDITVGNNNANGLTGYSAGTGYDLCTGIGVPNVALLVPRLIGGAVQSPAVFTSAQPTNSTLIGVPYSFTCTASGFPIPTFSLSGQLPPGLTLSTGGLISGTPAVPGTFAGTIRASNTGSTATQTFLITVQSVPATAPIFSNGPPALAAMGQPFNFTYTAFSNPPATFSLVGGSLPPGLTLASNGVISGTPNYPGDFWGTVMASNGLNPPATQSFTISVPYSSPTPPVITSLTNPSTASTGVPYNFTFTASGNPAPTFSLTSGPLPPGLTLSSGGVLSGTPTQQGSFFIVIRATNTYGIAEKYYSIVVVVNTVSPTLPVFTSGTLPTPASTDTFYSYSYTATGNPNPTFKVVTGNLPPGLSLTKEGLLAGTPVLPGTFSWTVQASNGVSSLATRNDSLTVQFVSPQPPTFTNSVQNGSATLWSPYSFTYTATAVPAASFALGYGNLPAGLSLSSTGILSGTPTQSGTFSGTINAVSRVGSASQPFTITVNYPTPPVVTNHLPRSATINQPISFALTSTGGPAPTYSVTSGALPPGLTLSSAGILSGTPTQLGTFFGTFTATNGYGPDANQNFVISIVENPISQFSILCHLTTSSGTFGSTPIQDASGNFYVSLTTGGTGGAGAIVKITPAGVETVLHNFSAGSPDGGGQSPGALVFGSDGNMYGASSTSVGPYSYPSTLFKISPSTGFLTVLSTGGVADVVSPWIASASGDFYTASTNYGAIVKVTPTGQVQNLNFVGRVEAALTFGVDGSYYGVTTPQPYGSGSLFKTNAQGNVTILHNFQDGTVANEGRSPNSIVTQTADGNLYGLNQSGSTGDTGTIYKFSPQGVASILHRFGDGTIANDADNNDGTVVSGLVAMPDGYLYGMSTVGGYSDQGTLYRISPTGEMRILHSFGDGTTSNDGLFPIGGLIAGKDGKLYGMTEAGGANGAGTLFQVTLPPLAPTFTNAPLVASALINIGYSFTFTATGLPAPTFSLASGTLPPGLTLSPTGVLSGTPNTAGLYTGTILASNGIGTSANQNFTITVPVNSQTIGAFAAIPDQTYGNGPLTVTIPAASSTLPVTVTVKSGPATISGTSLTLTGAGTVVLAANQAGNINYAPAPEVTTSFTAAKADQTISLTSPGSVTYGQSLTLTAPSTSGLPVTYSVVSGFASLSGNVVTFSDTGSVVLAANQPGNGNYNPASQVTISFTVAKASQTLSDWQGIASPVYGDAPFSIVPPTSDSGLAVTLSVVQGPATLSGTTLTLTGAGTVVLAADQPGNGNYFAAARVTTSFVVAAQHQTITFPAIDSHYLADGPFTFTLPTVDSGRPVTVTVKSGPATVSGNTITPTGAGLVTLAANSPGDGNYISADEVTVTFTVLKTAQSISFPPVSNVTFGNTTTLNATSSSGLPITYQVVSGPATISGNVASFTGAGSVKISGNQDGNDTYTAAAPVTITFSVLKASQTVTFPAVASQPFNGPPVALSASASTGLPITYSILSGPGTVSGNLLSFTGVGYVTVQATQAGNANYNSAGEHIRISGNKGTQTITFPAIPAQKFGNAPITLGATASSSLPVSYSVTGPASVAGNILTLTGAGSVSIKASQAGDATYGPAATVTANLTVAKASQTVTFPTVPATPSNTPGVALSATASTGLPITYSILSGPGTVSGNLLTFTGVGYVTVQATQAGNANYNSAGEHIRISATKGTQTISFPVVAAQTFGNAPVTLAATATSGLPVAYSVTGPGTLSGNVLTITGAGTITITANQAGNATFGPAAAVKVTVVVAKANQIVTFPAVAARAFTSPPVELTASASSGLPITYNVLSGPGTLNGNFLTLTGAGVVTVQASQPGNANFNSAGLHIRITAR